MTPSSQHPSEEGDTVHSLEVVGIASPGIASEDEEGSSRGDETSVLPRGHRLMIVLVGCPHGVSASYSTSPDGCVQGRTWTPRSPHPTH